ncbi:uncharacterized protein LOC110723613 [Chenopodium quinoa]|uniref:uncharacterized protein LOC110723613 n=1 Tax=Chenopodium quinoa TaxID=63459 RepID=UPI000B787054|nr:uncharacterized protein LOC110723613 [Chenopodium quinoa]
MGNCIKPQSQAIWGGEDWTPAMMTEDEKSAMKKEEEELAITYDSKETKSSTTSKIKEVKVKVTKRQLEKWLGKMNVEQKGLCVEQALAQLIKVSVHCKTYHRSWRPMLQTIYEV